VKRPRHLLPDRWGWRRWACWPLCALRGHPDTFWLESRWIVLCEPVTARAVARCSCERRTREAARP
jgi:hypothetical protein